MYQINDRLAKEPESEDICSSSKERENVWPGPVSFNDLTSNED